MLIRFLIACGVFLMSSIAAGEAARPDKGSLLTADRLELVSPVRCLDRAGDGKFVRVDIARVTNPGEVPLAFQVHFQHGESAREYLGSFALFPASNPGRFIVPTGGVLNDEGKVILVMEPLPDDQAADAVEVWVRSVDLTDGLGTTR